jgi:AbrB family looped-hinge helix DNA binding protein
MPRLAAGWNDRRGRFDGAAASSYAPGKMKAATRLTSKGQVVIPKPVRDRLRWRSGTRLELEVVNGGSVRLTATKDDLLDRLAGCLTEGDPLAELEAEHRAEVAGDGRRRRR